VTRRSIKEYAEELKKRYFRASREEKGKMLDEFTQVTGLHRKSAIRLLRRRSQSRADKRCGRPAVYKELMEPLKVVWEASDRLCSKPLQPFLPEKIKVLRQHGEKELDASTAAQLCKMSPSTIYRLLSAIPKGRRPEGAYHHQGREPAQELDICQDLCRLAGEQAWLHGDRPGSPLW
jgi:hypothetical protein